MHPLLIAARLLVRDMGGADEAAKHLGKSGTTLSHELNPNDRTAKLGLLDAATLTQASGNHLLATAFAAECGGVFLPLPDLAVAAGGQDTLGKVSKLVTEFGDVLREVASRTADGVVCDNDLAVLQAECLQLMSAQQDMLVHLARLNQAGKPPMLRAVA